MLETWIRLGLPVIRFVSTTAGLSSVWAVLAVLGDCLPITLVATLVKTGEERFERNDRFLLVTQEHWQVGAAAAAAVPLREILLPAKLRRRQVAAVVVEAEAAQQLTRRAARPDSKGDKSH